MKHLKASKIWAEEHLDEKKIGKIKIDKSKEKKIKIGYFSADFRTHAMGITRMILRFMDFILALKLNLMMRFLREL